MSMIDFTQMQTPQGQAEAARAAHLNTARAACHARIQAVCSLHTQLNLTAAAAAGRLGAKDRAAYAALLDWIDAMRTTTGHLAADPQARISDDAGWPAVPDSVADCIARF